ncbi:MAG: hypothetical protein LQ347_000229 [Umbilicaria vellea]|nr:MAG: hypothetical protein LQ347_000229 [Umbilicaria vellea]
MAFLFRKSRPDLCRSARELLPRLWDSPTPQKVEEELAKVLAQMKLVLQGTHETESSPDQVLQLINSMIHEDLLYSLARSIHLLPFESRKDTQAIFSHVLRFKPLNSTALDPPALAYIIDTRPEVIVELCWGYEHRESAMPCGVVLREALKHDAIAEIILYDQSIKGEKVARINDIALVEKQTGNGIFWNFFSWIDGGAFEVSTDAFTTFRDILTKHKQLVSQYLSINFDLFFSRYNSILVQSSSYVTKRQSIKLLGELLLDRANYNVMTAYVDRGEHLKLCMNLLKDDRKMVQYEGFHVFKVFVANPNKSVAVQRILLNNRERLLNFLPKFLEDRTEDDQFTDEKSFLIRQIETMPPVPVEGARPIDGY